LIAEVFSRVALLSSCLDPEDALSKVVEFSMPWIPQIITESLVDSVCFLKRRIVVTHGDRLRYTSLWEVYGCTG
jgi:hypothetical protein